jgi:23S rRNA pseudouridine1911/1915/1917 synthase
MTLYTLTQIGERLDVALTQAIPALSRARIQTLIETGAVMHEGKPLLSSNLRLKTAIEVEFILPPPQEATPEPQNIPLDIVYEDADLIVINKQKDIVVHPAAGNWTGTLVNALLYHCAGTLSGIGGVMRPGIVHRLDRDTTGLMVMAKNDAAHAHLSAQFADHGRNGPLRRAYKAFVWGQAPLKTTVNAPLERDKFNREKISVRKGGREAVTHLTKLAGDERISLVECRLETGRTHQIRVHMAHLGLPLLGDPLYGATHKSKINTLEPEAQAALLALNRQALHAYELGFMHPTKEEFMLFSSEFPPDLALLGETLRLSTKK